jgi:hypothetical protein
MYRRLLLDFERRFHNAVQSGLRTDVQPRPSNGDAHGYNGENSGSDQ